MLHNMAKQGEVHRVTRGFYSVNDDPAAVVFALRPAYIGLQDALSVRDLWEQETNVVVVTTGKAKPGVRTVMGSRVVVHRIDPRYFFGFDYVRHNQNFYVPVSDLEKTLIDLVYFGETPGKDVLKQLVKKVDKKKLEEYLGRHSEAFVSRFQRAIG
jgi:predicted transcriptional regulator of viral defense system